MFVMKESVLSLNDICHSHSIEVILHFVDVCI